MRNAGWEAPIGIDRSSQRYAAINGPRGQSVRDEKSRRVGIRSDVSEMLEGLRTVEHVWGHAMRFRRTPVGLPSGPYGSDVKRIRRYAGSPVPLGFVIAGAAVGAILGCIAGLSGMVQADSIHWVPLFMNTFVFGASPGAMVGLAVGRLVRALGQGRGRPR